MAWADMTPLERLQHSVKFGTDYQNKVTDPGLWDALRASYTKGSQVGYNSVNGTPVAPEGSKPPPGVSQYVWDRVSNNTFAGLNLGSVTLDAETRDALINAGYEDYVRNAYERMQQQRYDHYSSNDTDGSGVLANARDDWYTQNYGEWNPSESASASYEPGGLTFGGVGGSYGGGYYGGSAGGNAGGNAGGTDGAIDLSPGAGASVPTVERNRNYSVATASPMDAPVNTGIGTAGQAASTPFADAYVRASSRAQAEGPVTSMFKKFMQD